MYALEIHMTRIVTQYLLNVYMPTGMQITVSTEVLVELSNYATTAILFQAYSSSFPGCPSSSLSR